MGRGPTHPPVELTAGAAPACTASLRFRRFAQLFLVWHEPEVSDSVLKPDFLRWFSWLGAGSMFGILGFWYPLAVGLLLVPEDPDFRGGFVIIVALPFLVVASIWSPFCLRLIWTHSGSHPRRVLARAFAVLLAILLYVPLVCVAGVIVVVLILAL